MLPKPVELIVAYLGSSCGPGLDVFKFKMLCNQSMKVVNRQPLCENLELKQAHNRHCSISMFNNSDFNKYQGNCDEFAEIYSNAFWGKSLMLLVEKKSKACAYRARTTASKNNLRNKIMKSPTAGFLSLYNIRASGTSFHDIHILLTEEPFSDQHQLLTAWHRKYQNRPHFEKEGAASQRQRQKQLEYINRNLLKKPSKG